MKKIFIIFVLIVMLIFIFDKEKKEEMYSTWIWDLESNYIDEVSNYNINKVYVYLDINKDVNYYIENVKQLIDKKIEIEFLFGDPNYIYEENYNIMEDILSYIENYNKEVSEEYKIENIHVDVEPYILRNWETKQKSIILDYQSYLIYINNLFKNYNINVDIPFWFDTIYYDNQYGEGNLFDFICEYVDGITLMAYNDSADFIIENTKYEVNNFKNIEIAVEYKNLDEINTTFYDEGIDFMYEEINKVKNEFPNVNYAIHEIIN